MQQSKDYQPNQSRGILLLGPPGVGKTTTALQVAVGTPYIADCDNNLSGAHRFLGPDFDFLYDIIDFDDKGNEITPNLRFNHLSECVKAASSNDKVGTIEVDSFSKVSDYVMDDILRQQGRPQMQMQDWGVYLNVMKRTITALRSTRKLFIATAHVKPEKDEVSGIVRYFPALPGQIQHIIGALFSDVWLCEVQEKNNQHQFLVRCMPSTFYSLKNSLGLPPVTTAAEIKKALTNESNPSK